MPRIKPFYAFRPVVRLQNSVVTRPLENYSLGQARLMVSENHYSFLHLVNPELEHPYLRGSRQELVYKKIVENLEAFIEDKVLIKEEKPSIYIYRVKHDGLVQSGIWTLTHIDDYLNGGIRKHELTVERRERLLSDYLQQTGIDANPVLITYFPNQKVDAIIAKHQKQQPAVDFIFTDGSSHELWVINELEDLNTLTGAFSDITAVYIADGHHRIASMAKMAIQKRKLSSTTSDLASNYFSSAYFNSNQVQILAFNRLVKDLRELSYDEFFTAIKDSFSIQKVDQAVTPSKIHEFGMYINSSWYILTAKSHIYNDNDPIAVLDVSILQNFILEPILGIVDPRNDARITFEGGKTGVEELEQQVDHSNYAVAFTLYPTSIQQLIAVADAGRVMPPKSTWVEPKFLVGMLTNLF